MSSSPSTGGLVPRDFSLKNLTVSDVLCANKLNVNQLTISGSTAGNIPITVTALETSPSNPSIISNFSIFKPTDKLVCLQFIIETTIQPSQVVNLAQISSLYAPVIPVGGSTFAGTSAAGVFQVQTEGIVTFILGDNSIVAQLPVNITYSTV